MSDDYRPRVTKYLVCWPDKRIGGFEREDVLLIAIAENRSLGEAQVFRLECTLPTIYYPIDISEVRFPPSNSEAVTQELETQSLQP